MNGDGSGDSLCRMPDAGADFLTDAPAGPGREEAIGKLAGTDSEMGRVIEDLIAVLVGRGLIRITDLPEHSFRKLRLREALRARLGGETEREAN